jgi:hypothetical protein
MIAPEKMIPRIMTEVSTTIATVSTDRAVCHAASRPFEVNR